jgi:hypothetical protein
LDGARRRADKNAESGDPGGSSNRGLERCRLRRCIVDLFETDDSADKEADYAACDAAHDAADDATRQA